MPGILRARAGTAVRKGHFVMNDFFTLLTMGIRVLQVQVDRVAQLSFIQRD
jgi:hypothetical protein